MPRELSPEDVIDEVVLRAYREFVREPEWRRTATWLERLTREQLETECRRLEGERERSSQLTAWSKLVSIWTGLVRRASEPRRAHAETTAAPC
jgi:hypothetical protein